MKVLAIDTSGPNCSIAVIDEQKVIGSFAINIGKTHSETLLPLVDELLKYIGLSIEKIDAFACCIGPGSFTGIRIGIATIKGFALAINKPVIAVSSLYSLAYNASHFDGLICSMLDANNNNIYSALYQGENHVERIGDYFTDSIDEWIAKLKTISANILFVGDGSITYQQQLKEALQDRAYFVPQHMNEQSAISLARAALYQLQKGETETAENLHPLYLRKSQAERMEEAKNN